METTAYLMVMGISYYGVYLPFIFNGSLDKPYTYLEIYLCKLFCVANYSFLISLQYVPSHKVRGAVSRCIYPKLSILRLIFLEA